MKSAVRRASPSRHTASKPHITSEVRQIHRSLERLESRLTTERSESNRLRRISSNANNHYILGSTLIGLGLFLLSGVPMPSNAASNMALGSQVMGGVLGLLGLAILIRAYREWHATSKGSHGRRRNKLILALVGVGLLVLVGVSFYAGLRVAHVIS